MKNDKLTLLRFVIVFLLLIYVFLYIVNPLKKSYNLGLFGIIFPFTLIVAEWFLRKSEIKRKLSWTSALLIMIIVYFLI